MIKGRYLILIVVLIVVVGIIVGVTRKDTKSTQQNSQDTFFIPQRGGPNRLIPNNLQDAIWRQSKPVTDVTIIGRDRTRVLTISVNRDGIISFTESVTVMAPNNKNLPVSSNNRTVLTRLSYYTENGQFYSQTTTKYNTQRPITKKVCYDLSKGPVQKPHIFSLDSFLEKNGYTFTEVYGKEGSVSLTEFDKVFAPHVGSLRREGKDLLSTRQDFFETPFFNFFGKIDRLYKPDGQVNNKFLGVKSISITRYRALVPPFKLGTFTCQNEYTYTETNTDGQNVEKSIPFKPFEEKPFKLFMPKEYGYDNNIVSDDIIRLDPVQGIDFDILMTKFENVPDLQELANAFDAESLEELGDKLPRGKKFGDYSYYPVSEKLSRYVEVNGIVRGLSKSTEAFIEQTRKQYNSCKAELRGIVQPLNQQGNACPDSQDIELSQYSYYPAKNCDWVKVGDAWCSYEEMARDKLVICEWGKLYHGTSDRFINAIMFTFSGTNDFSDVITDISFLPTTIPRINAFLHSGFYDEFMKWFPRILRYLKVQPIGNRREFGNAASFTIKYRTPYKKIIFNGHSLGGAQAQIAAAYFRNLFNLDEVDIEIASQASPYPFMFPTKPKDYGTIPHSKRLVGYFYDECPWYWTRGDPVVDVMCSPMFGSYCHTTPETSLTDYVEREWDWNPFSGGWTRCTFVNRYPRNWQPPMSILEALNAAGLDIATLGLSFILEKLIGAIEHPLGRYREKVSRLCPDSNDPNDGDKKQIICDAWRAENDLNPDQGLEAMINNYNCPPYSL